MVPRKVISADSHMTEPADLWVERLDRKYRDAAPRVVSSEEKSGPVWMFVAPGVSPTPVAGLFSAGKRGEELREFFKHGYEAARPSGWDPVERLKDQDIDGVVAEVLYSSLGLKLFGVNDPELQLACLKVYNEWLAEFCAHDPKRLLGVGLYSLEALPDVSEIERCARMGLKGILILATDGYQIRIQRRALRSDVAGMRRAESAGFAAQAAGVGHEGDPGDAHRGRPPDPYRAYRRAVHDAAGVWWNLRALSQAQGSLGGERRRLDCQLGPSAGPCARDDRAARQACRWRPANTCGATSLRRSRTIRWDPEHGASLAPTISCGPRTFRIPTQPFPTRAR